jgi:hypothetical protein
MCAMQSQNVFIFSVIFFLYLAYYAISKNISKFYFSDVCRDFLFVGWAVTYRVYEGRHVLQLQFVFVFVQM